MFSKEIKIGIKKAHGIKAKVFSEMLTVMAPTVNWRLGASAPTWERLPWDANDADARFCWFPVLVPFPLVPVCTFGRKYTQSGGGAKIPCLYLVQKDFSKKTQLTEATMILRMRCPFLLPSRSLTPLNLFPKKIQTKYRPDKI